MTSYYCELYFLSSNIGIKYGFARTSSDATASPSSGRTAIDLCGAVILASGKHRKQMDVGQNGRPKWPQMEMSSLVLTIQLLGYLILTHTQIDNLEIVENVMKTWWTFHFQDCFKILDPSGRPIIQIHWFYQQFPHESVGINRCIVARGHKSGVQKRSQMFHHQGVCFAPKVPWNSRYFEISWGPKILEWPGDRLGCHRAIAWPSVW